MSTMKQKLKSKLLNAQSAGISKITSIVHHSLQLEFLSTTSKQHRIENIMEKSLLRLLISRNCLNDVGIT